MKHPCEGCKDFNEEKENCKRTPFPNCFQSPKLTQTPKGKGKE